MKTVRPQWTRRCAEEVKATTKEAEKNGILGHGLHHPFHTMFEDVFEELPWHLARAGSSKRRVNVKIKWPDQHPMDWSWQMSD